MGKRKAKTSHHKKQKKEDVNIPSVIIIMILGLLSYVYISNVMIQIYSSRQVLGVSTYQLGR